MGASDVGGGGYARGGGGVVGGFFECEVVMGWGGGAGVDVLRWLDGWWGGVGGLAAAGGCLLLF